METAGERVTKKFQEMGHAYYDELIDLVNEEVAAEREACAKIAEQAEVCDTCDSEGWTECSATGDIAKVIRARGEQ